MGRGRAQASTKQKRGAISIAADRLELDPADCGWDGSVSR